MKSLPHSLRHRTAYTPTGALRPRMSNGHIVRRVARFSSSRFVCSPCALAETRVYLLRGWFGVFSTGIDKMAEDLRAKGIKAEPIGHLEWKATAEKIASDRAAGATRSAGARRSLAGRQQRGRHRARAREAIHSRGSHRHHRAVPAGPGPGERRARDQLLPVAGMGIAAHARLPGSRARFPTSTSRTIWGFSTSTSTRTRGSRRRSSAQSRRCPRRADRARHRSDGRPAKRPCRELPVARSVAPGLRRIEREARDRPADRRGEARERRRPAASCKRDVRRESALLDREALRDEAGSEIARELDERRRQRRRACPRDSRPAKRSGAIEREHERRRARRNRGADRAQRVDAFGRDLADERERDVQIGGRRRDALRPRGNLERVKRKSNRPRFADFAGGTFVDLFEYQGELLFPRYGIPVSPGAPRPPWRRRWKKPMRSATPSS